MSSIHRLLQNSFEIQTRESHRSAYRFLTDTRDKLKGSKDPLIAPIKNAFTPFYDAYHDVMIKWQVEKGIYRGLTLGFVKSMQKLKVKLPYWEAKVRSVFLEDSPDEVEIFPKKRTPFLSGNYEQRVNAIGVLSKKLEALVPSHPELTEVYEDARDFFALCLEARDKQQQSEGRLALLSIARESQRVVTMNAYFGLVYCGLGQLYYNNLNGLKGFMDLSLLYKKVKKKEEE